MPLAQARENFTDFGAVNELSLQFLEADRLELYSKISENMTGLEG